MAKILFVNPMIREEDDPRHVPYGMALLASIADKLGHQVQVYDANAWRLGDRELGEAIQADNWDVIATGGITTTYGYVKKTVAYAKQLYENGGHLARYPERRVDMYRMPDHVVEADSSISTYRDKDGRLRWDSY